MFARWLTLLLAVAVLGCFATTALAADPKKQCLRSFQEAQVLRKDGKLLAAFEHLTTCAQAQCPAVVNRRCGEWRREVEIGMPSIVVGLTDRSGRDVVDASVAIDGKVVTTKLDGKAIPIDPGARVITVRMKNNKVLQRKLVIRQGEKFRQVQLDLRPAPSRAALAVPKAQPVRPDKLKYEKGMEIPHGYQKTTRVRKGLVVAGAVTLGSLWAITALSGVIVGTNSTNNDHLPLYVPIVGPFVAVGTLATGSSATGVLVVDGVLQTGFAAMFILGIALPKTILARTYQGVEVNMLPTLSPLGASLSPLGASLSPSGASLSPSGALLGLNGRF
jgi:hypothetical protein